MPETAGRLLFVLNPAAGNAKTADITAAINSRVSPHCRLCQIVDQPGNLDDTFLDEQISRTSPDVVIAVGGDGTVSSVARAAFRNNTTLGIIPLGTANVLARALDIPIELNAALQVLLSGRTKQVDGMEADGTLCFSHISAGVYSQITDATSPRDKRKFGQLAYVKTLLAETARRRAYHFQLEVDNKKRDVFASCIMLANAGESGLPGVHYGAQIDPTDGAIDVCIVHARSTWEYVKLIMLGLAGRFADSEQIEYLQARQCVRLSTLRHLPIRGDGEQIGHSQVTVDVKQQCLRILVPEK